MNDNRDLDFGEGYRVITDDDAFREIFGDAKDSVCQLPNIVMPAGPRPLEIVLETVGSKGGVFLDNPPFEQNGDLYSSLLDVVPEFRLWGAESNQQVLTEKGSRPKLGCFTMVLDLQLPDDVIQAFSDEGDPSVAPWISDMYPRIAKWIDKLRWAYFPVRDDYFVSMFMTAPRFAHWVDQVEAKLRGESISCTRVIQKHGHCTWHLDDVLRERCGLLRNSTDSDEPR